VFGRILGTLGKVIGDAAEEMFIIIALEGSAGTPGELEFEKRCREEQKLRDAGNCKVGRWMGPSELANMQGSKTVKNGTGNQSRVAFPADPSAYQNAPKGDIYVEYWVPCNSLSKGGSPKWRSIYGPDHPFAQKLGITEYPPALGIRPLLVKCYEQHR